MDVQRAADIIAAYGGDTLRWPADERAAMMRLVATNPGIAEQARAAAAMDSVFAGWALAPVVPGNAAAAAARVLASLPRRRDPTTAPAIRWMAGGGIAAALVAGMLLGGPHLHAPTAPAAHLVSDEQAFATIFTPTPEEDGSI